MRRASYKSHIGGLAVRLDPFRVLDSGVRNLVSFGGLARPECSPYLHRRDCSAPKPGKKKQKRYNYSCAV
jgi:hypothetical protein